MNSLPELLMAAVGLAANILVHHKQMQQHETLPIAQLPTPHLRLRHSSSNWQIAHSSRYDKPKPQFRRAAL